jgi:hypothetical protein
MKNAARKPEGHCADAAIASGNRLCARLTALRVLTPFALGYFLTYLLRAVNAVVAPDLVAELGAV